MNKHILIKPSILAGDVVIPSSKSVAHRMIICAALSQSESKISNVSLSEDILTTITALEGIGCKIIKEETVYGIYNLNINGANTLKDMNSTTIAMNESGSSLRFLIPILLLANNKINITGTGKLPERPLQPFFDIFNKKGIKYSYSSKNNYYLPLTISGGLPNGEYNIPGDVSSQFITGLLFALPLCEGDSVINIIGELQSYPYVDLTLQSLNMFGINIINNNYKSIYIKGKQQYMAANSVVEGDYSQAAFYCVANALGCNINISGVNKHSLQGDKIIEKLCSDFINNKVDKIIDVKNIPDLVPILAVLYSFYGKKVIITNAARVRLKECDRLHAIAKELNLIGGNIEEMDDGLIINPITQFAGGNCSSHNDHRITMALAIASVKSTKEIVVDNPSCVAKSYPNFFEHFEQLGGTYVIR